MEAKRRQAIGAFLPTTRNHREAVVTRCFMNHDLFSEASNNNSPKTLHLISSRSVILLSSDWGHHHNENEDAHVGPHL
jgi:hypothetical protein